MGFDRSAYVKANPKRRTYEVGGITWTMPNDAAFGMLAVFKRHGLKGLSEAAIQDLILANGKVAFRDFAKEVILVPLICATEEEAIEKNGLTVEELDPRHMNELIGKLLADWQEDGHSEASTFPDGGVGPGAGASRPGVRDPAASVAGDGPQRHGQDQVR